MAGKANVPSQALLGTRCVVHGAERFLYPHLSQFFLPPSARVPPVCLTETPGQSSPPGGWLPWCNAGQSGLLPRMEALATAGTWALGLSGEHQPPLRSTQLPASLAAVILCGDEGGAPGEEDVGTRAHGACASFFVVCLLSSSNVSSTTCHRQLSRGNSLSTRLTRK